VISRRSLLAGAGAGLIGSLPIARSAAALVTGGSFRRVYTAEGDSVSILPSGTICYPYDYATPRPKIEFYNHAVPGSYISITGNANNVTDRAGTLLTPPAPSTKIKFVLSLLIGANDIMGSNGVTSGYTTTFIQQVSDYCDARRAAGWFMALGTLAIKPSPDSNMITNVAAVNTAFGGWVGTHIDALYDIAADPVMSQTSNTTYYGDGVHMTATGASYTAANIVGPVLTTLLA